MNIFRKFSGQIEHAQGSQRFHVLLVYFSILLDNLLLTVVGMNVFILNISK